MNTFRTMADQLKVWISEAREQLSQFGTPVWGATDPQSDRDHISDFTTFLTNSRERFDLEDETQMHSLRLLQADKSFVTCLTGNTPGAGDRARALAGFLLSMPTILNTLESGVTEIERVSELLEHNTKQLLENRTQRETIRRHKEVIDWLIGKIGVEYVAPEADAA